jgi:uncharacterized protein involved in exopolysaccharide biosynthesis
MTSFTPDQAKSIYLAEEAAKVTGNLLNEIADLRTRHVFEKSMLEERIKELEEQLAQKKQELAAFSDVVPAEEPSETTHD